MTVVLIDSPEETARAAQPQRRWTLFRRRSGRPTISGDPSSERVRRLEETRAVLEGARTVLERGWVQEAWYVVRSRSGRVRTVGWPGVVRWNHEDVEAACLVGAVVRSVSLHSGGSEASDAGPAIDVLWDALGESRGERGPGVAGRCAPREVRAARVRDLTRWNDRPGRTREDVLHLVDVAVARTMMTAVREPVDASR